MICKLSIIGLTVLVTASIGFAQGSQNAPASTNSTQTQPKNVQKQQPQPIALGPSISLKVERFDRNSFIDIAASVNQLLTGELTIQSGNNNKGLGINFPATLFDLTTQINNLGFDAELAPSKSGSTLVLKSRTSNPGESVNITGELETKPEAKEPEPKPPQATEPKTKEPECKCDQQQPSPQTFTFSRGTPDYKISLDPASRAELERFNSAQATKHSEPLAIYVRVGDGTLYDLAADGWWLDGRAKPLGLLTIGNQSDPVCDNEVADSFEAIASGHCHKEFTLARRLQQEDVIKATLLNVPKENATNQSLLTKQAKQSYLIISRELLDDSNQFVLVSGKRLDPNYGPFQFDLSYGVALSIYRKRDGCRLFSHVDYDWATLKFYPPPPRRAGTKSDNGIAVGPGKIFDTVVLKRMLSDTAAQLASISGFSSASITSAFGNFQGVTRDVSFLSAQVTTTPLPTVASTLASGTTGNSGTTNTTPIAGLPGTVTIQCPDGSLPTIGSGGLQQCTPASNVNGSSSSITTVPAGTSQQVVGTTNNQQNTQTTTSGGFGPTIPTAPVSTALSAPTNVGVSSSDILAEQVQLNSQITTLRLLLQGAASDQYLTSDSQAVATRQQTTLGFAVSIDPPRQYKHGVAEVRIVIVPPAGRDGVSIMTLLPSEKTYNVAKITSHQNSFGAGVTVEPVSAGVNTGKSKDRLYLAKDTDTIALQYPGPEVSQYHRAPLPFWHKAHDDIVGTINLNPFDPCEPLFAPTKGAVVFGWQFRPVLGAAYVKGGQRQVFAQLALPAGLNDIYVPTVYVQTRWRAYDSSRQVVGPVYKYGCSVDTDRSGIELLNPLLVREMNVTDIGNGQVRLTAKGTFFASGMTVRSGLTNVTPTAFDGTNVETFASVHDVLQTGDLSLVSQNGVKQPFAIVTDPRKISQCGITEADMVAVPRPDGNAHVHLHMKLGSAYTLTDDSDGLPQPFVLIGSQVYGVQENPFVRSPGCRTVSGGSSGADCDFVFLAPTSSLRNAQSFLVQDIAWDSLKKRGTIDFAPAFDKLAITSTYPTDDPFDPNKTTPATKAKGTDQTFFTVSGFDFGKLDTTDSCNDSLKQYCLRWFVGKDSESPPSFTIASQNLATFLFSLKDVGKATTVRFQVVDKPLVGARVGPDLPVEWDLPVPKADASTAKPAVSPAYLYKGDSQTVTVSGGGLDFSYVRDVLFEKTMVFQSPPKPDSSELKFLVSTDVTKSPGRKEFTIELVDKDGKPSKATISVDVVLR
jgi:hypothetical protein